MTIAHSASAAGIQKRTDFAGCAEATWAELMDVNMNGVYRAVRVNAIAPTAIPSGMTSDLFSNTDYVANKVADIPSAATAPKQTSSTRPLAGVYRFRPGDGTHARDGWGRSVR